MTPTNALLLGLAIGSCLGATIGWLLAARRRDAAAAGAGAGPDLRVEAELRQQLSQRDAEVSQLRGQAGELASARAGAEAAKQSAEALLATQQKLHERQMEEARMAQDRALVELRQAFKALSVDALREVQPQFIERVGETFARLQETAKGDLAQRQQAIATLVEPLKQQLETYQRRLQQSETAQSSALGEVKKHLESLAAQSTALSSETLQLRRVLSSNQARGRWGEETLRRVVEAAGMSAHCDFSEQTQAGDAKPDLIVRLPGDRLIIVDAKVPDLEFLGALDEADPVRRAEALATHAARLKATIRALGERDYPRQFPNALDHVVLFVPAESLFSAALEGDSDLIVWAAGRKILLATPASLIALLRSVAVSWQQHSQSENAQEIARMAQELYARVAKFTEHFGRIRDSLGKATEAYNDAVGSYERQVRPSGERLAKLGGGAEGKVLAAVPEIELGLRPPPGAAS